MASPEITREIVPMLNEELHDVLEFILSQHVAAKTQPFKGNELRGVFHKFEEIVADLPFVKGKFQTDWGIGQGKWADIPWLAILDPRETNTVQKGVYCILLFRDECSGVYVTLNQGITEAKKLGADKARSELASRADAIRKQISSLAQKGFQLDNQIDLRTSGDRAIWYQRGTIAHKLYQQGKVPPDADIISDLKELLTGYSTYVDGRPERTWIFQANPEFYDIHGALAQMQEHTWMVRQHADQIRSGDKVYLWAAGKDAGIVAYGRVTSDPSKFPPNPEEQRFTLRPEKFDGDWVRVRLHTEDVLTRPLLKTELAQVPALAALSIIKSSRRTNFPVTREEAAAIAALLNRNGDAPVRSPAKFDRAQALAHLIEAIQASGFIFEPWQIATYVTALRTKPFVILAGISGTGKSKLPALVRDHTGGNCRLVPVRPDWTDSSDVLGYCDLQGNFKEGVVLAFAGQACRCADEHFVCVLDEMNLARVEQYSAEILSTIENRRPSGTGGFESRDALLTANLHAAAGAWSKVKIPPNFAFVGTVNMDETTHSFSRKVLDRAFTLELSEVDLGAWGSNEQMQPPSGVAEKWPVEAWYPRAVHLSTLSGSLAESEQTQIQKTIEILIELNRYLSHAQLQFGYRTRNEICLFVLHALETPAAFVTRSGTPVNTLDLAIQLKVLPRIVGGSYAVRRLLMRLMGWARTGSPLENDSQADLILGHWDKEGRPAALPDARFPRTAAKLCLMWERIATGSYTSFWL